MKSVNAKVCKCVAVLERKAFVVVVSKAERNKKKVSKKMKIEWKEEKKEGKYRTTSLQLEFLKIYVQ